MHNRTLYFTLVLITGLLNVGALQAADVEQTYNFYCAQCHGPEGKGDGPNVNEHFATDPRNFTETAEMQKLSDADIRNVIADGGPAVSKSELMPPWSKTISDEDIEALVGHLRKLCACEGAP